MSIKDGSGTVLSQSAIGNRYLFQGREYDSATGLYYFRARWYDPETGRWLSKDPIGITGGLNLYVFCDNNPVNFVDPMGHQEAMPAATGVNAAFDGFGLCNYAMDFRKMLIDGKAAAQEREAQKQHRFRYGTDGLVIIADPRHPNIPPSGALKPPAAPQPSVPPAVPQPSVTPAGGRIPSSGKKS